MSSNEGSTWHGVNNGISRKSVAAVASSDSGTLFAASSSGMYISTNHGLNWAQRNNGLTNPSLASIAFSKGTLFAGTMGSGVFVSSDSGQHWTQSNNGISNESIRTITVASDGWIFIGTTNGVFDSRDNGSTWNQLNEGLSNLDVRSIAIDSKNTTYAGTYGAGVFISTIATSVKNNSPIHASVFSLGQNYPNPFNPSTVITYQLPANSFVTLRVYDEVGREMRTLVNERQTIGNHSLTFYAGELPSGIYFYRLQAGSYIQTKKFVFIK
jgi:hypothetical protein